MKLYNLYTCCYECWWLKCTTTATCRCRFQCSATSAALHSWHACHIMIRCIEDAQYVHHMLCTLTCRRRFACICIKACRSCPCSPGMCRSCTQWQVVATARSFAVRQNKSYASSSTQASKVGGASSMTGSVALMSSSAGANAEITLMPRSKLQKQLHARHCLLINFTQRYHTNVMLAALQSSSSSLS